MFLGVFGRSGAWALPRPFQFDSEIGVQCHRLLFDAHRGEVGNRCFQDGIASCYVIGHRAEAAEQSSHYYFESRKGFGGNGELTELKKREVNDRRSPPRNNFIAQSFFHHPTNRYSDGRLVIDFVAQALSLPFLPPYRSQKANTSTGVNFAVAGSTAIPHEFFVKNNLTLDITPQSIQTQLIWFNEFLEKQGCRGATKNSGCTFDDTLFWVGEIGANDYAYTVGSSVPGSTIQELGIKSITSFLQVLK